MRTPSRLTMVVATMLVAGCASDTTAPKTTPAPSSVLTGPYTAITLPTTYGCGVASAINASGEAAGNTCHFQGADAVAWSATDHAVTFEEYVGPSTITGISDNGVIVGNAYLYSIDISDAVKWKNGQATRVDEAIGGDEFDPNKESLYAAFICATDCTIVGFRQPTPYVSFPPPTTAEIWLSGGARIDIPGPGGTSARFAAIGGGFFFGNSSLGASRWTSAHGWEALPLPSGWSHENSYLVSANASGDAIGSAQNEEGGGVTILWPHAGSFVPLDAPDGYRSFVPTHINASGMIVGWLTDTSATFQTFAAYWTAQQGFRLLPDGAGGQANSVNDRGEIVGYANGDGYNSGTPLFWEPIVGP